MQKSRMIKAGQWMLFGLSLSGAFLLGQKMSQQERLNDMDDSIARIASAQYALMDMAVRINHHVNPKHPRGTPFCPECFELSKKIEGHSEPVTNDNAESVMQGN